MNNNTQGMGGMGTLGRSIGEIQAANALGAQQRSCTPVDDAERYISHASEVATSLCRYRESVMVRLKDAQEELQRIEHALLQVQQLGAVVV